MNQVLEDLKKLKNIYFDTEEVSLGEKLKVELRVISSEEETDAHTFALQYDQGLAYIYSVKRETVCRAIFKINGEELPEYIEENGKTIQRHVWIRDNIVSGWNQIMIDKIWLGYSNLLNRLDYNIGGDILSDIEDIKEKTKDKDEQK